MMNLEHILSLMQASSIPHTDEVVDGFRRGTVHLDTTEPQGSGTGCEELLSLYRMRSESKRDGIPTEHSLRMNREAKQLADRLACFPGKKCHILTLTAEPNISYGIFVLTDMSDVVGCTWGLDARKTPPEEWKRLWGRSENA